MLIKGRWSLKRKIKTKKYRPRNKTAIYIVVAYGKWSLKRVVVKRELTVYKCIYITARNLERASAHLTVTGNENGRLGIVEICMGRKSNNKKIFKIRTLAGK